MLYQEDIEKIKVLIDAAVSGVKPGGNPGKALKKINEKIVDLQLENQELRERIDEFEKPVGPVEPEITAGHQD